jgi:hypothetical protein
VVPRYLEVISPLSSILYIIIGRPPETSHKKFCGHNNNMIYYVWSLDFFFGVFVAGGEHIEY